MGDFTVEWLVANDGNEVAVKTTPLPTSSRGRLLAQGAARGSVLVPILKSQAAWGISIVDACCDRWLACAARFHR